MADGNEYNIFEIGEKGGPVAPVYATEGSPFIVQPSAIFEKAAHPNAARLLVEFLLSEEGQTVLKDADYLPANRKIPAMKNGLRPEDGGFKATWMRPDVVDPQMANWARIAKELFR